MIIRNERTVILSQCSNYTSIIIHDSNSSIYLGNGSHAYSNAAHFAGLALQTGSHILMGARHRNFDQSSLLSNNLTQETVRVVDVGKNGFSIITFDTLIINRTNEKGKSKLLLVDFKVIFQ